ncbi:MAG: bifunctional nuclease family protein [Candidatus Coatesbacteria bacterium]|nr:MAG: bifunctional nuclease family protein [Candidatus Coatesbacteria bacterium]RLC41660.1 MAG: bifunctional nuclease family protein [Candidatus Coatesbacteria bacterium]RLC43910.1 MAG: bifunctional nuclease family protein [Candidatus Coatesbacteria bacterium]HEC80063.1 bifunctional nuclease family protein [Bacillota bacterium]
MHKVIVMGITFDSTNNSPVVILKDANNERILPIWIGPFEANSILMELEGIKTPRPMTHDLAKRIIHSLGAKVESVIINDIKDNTFYAQINLVTDGSTTAIDSRPSDAIAIAIRTSSPIYVADHVIAIGHITKDNQETKERVKEFINQLKPEDFINAEDDK